VVWLERAKTGEELVFLNFPQLLQLLINVNRNEAIQRKAMEICHVFTITACWIILPPLLLADSGFFGISQWLSDTL
jgi:hypothetical protein